MTLAIMRARILDEMANDGALTSNQIDNAIRTAIKHHERESFWFSQKTTSFDTVAGQEFYESTPPETFQNIVRIVSMRCGPDGSKELLRGLDNSFVDEMQDGSITGEPAHYSLYESKIRLYPIPEAVYSITLRYIQKFSTVSADTDTNPWLTECEEMIRQGAKRVLCTDILHNDEMAGRYAALEDRALSAIKAENRTRQPQTTLRADLPFGRNFSRHDHVRYW